MRGDDGELRAFYNVCRHRGARLRDEPNAATTRARSCARTTPGATTLKGDLVVTPKVDEDELDRSKLSLWPVHLDEWQGFVFVNLTKEHPRPVREHDRRGVRRHARASSASRSTSCGSVPSTEWMVEANWKIIIENYNECLHCPTVHPELVDVIPAYRKGWVFEDGRDDGGVTLASGRRRTPPASRRCRCSRR